MKKLLAILAACLCTGQAAAATHSVVCHGCDEPAMYEAAALTTQKGIVYVFDPTDGDAQKFKVDTEIISLRPYWAMTWGDPLPVEPDVDAAFDDFSRAYGEIDPNQTIVMPPDFPIRSVAGAMLDPNEAAVRVVDHLRSLDNYDKLELNSTALGLALLARNIPLLNLSDFLKYTKIIVEFPDGSTIEFKLFFSNNAANALANVEVELIGHARMPDGSPAPSSDYGFRNFTVQDQNGSLLDWIMWAQRNGIPVTGAGGGSDGTYMECDVSGNYIHCRVYKKN